MLVLLLLIFIEFISSKEYYVSSANGSDVNPGTLLKPFKTISKAQSTIRPQLPQAEEDFYVHIRSGVYVESLKFDPTDSGKNGHRVFYQTYEVDLPNVAVLSGSSEPTAPWNLFSKDNNIYSTVVDKANINFRHLYVNGIAAKRATTGIKPLPNVTIVSDFGYVVPGGWEGSSWKNQNQIEFVIDSYWKQPRCLVDFIRNVNADTEIHMQADCWNKLKTFGNIEGIPEEVMIPAQVPPKRIENALELIEYPSQDEIQWYFSESDRLLFIRLPMGKTPQNYDIQIPKWERAILITGSHLADNDIETVDNLSFKNLKFTQTTWTSDGPSTSYGFPEIQANVWVGKDGQLCTPIGSVEVHFAKSIHFIQNEFEYPGAIGLFLGSSVRFTHVINNKFYYSPSHAIKMGDLVKDRDDIQLMTRDNVIFNNEIRNSANEFHGGPAVMIGYVKNCTMTHNLIVDSAYTGISNSWGWAAVVSNFAGWNKFCWNHVSDSMEELFDGGSFYTLGACNDSLLAYNFFEKSQSLYGSFYLDDGSRWWEAHHNVVFGNVETSLIKGGDHNLHDMYWQNRGKVIYHGQTVDDLKFMNNHICGPCDPTCKDCGPIVQKDMHEITSLDEVPKSILDNVGITKLPLDMECQN